MVSRMIWRYEICSRILQGSGYTDRVYLQQLDDSRTCIFHYHDSLSSYSLLSSEKEVILQLLT